jgi:hypothetical protein
MTYDPTPKPGKCPIKFRIEASTSDPRERTGFERGNISTYELKLARGDAEVIARGYLSRG